MDNDNTRILHLLEKFNNGTASPNELRELDSWYDTFDQNKKLTDTLYPQEIKNMEHRLLSTIDRQIDKRLGRQSGPLTVQTRGRWLAVIAILAVFLTIGYLTVRTFGMFNGEQMAKNDVKPGGSKAILILGNGKRIDLSSSKSGVISNESGVTIAKTTGTRLTYLSDDQASDQKDHGEGTTNTIITPNGGQYEVQLPDGTHVWLNAASSLTYPVHFVGGQRTVWLTGEGYFEVAKDKTRPFDVSTGTQHVRVLGTHFNINAYPGEDSQKTTLLEGSVQVLSKANAIMLKPGEQAVNNGIDLNILHLNAEDAIMWKNGLFHFDHTELHALMRELARWYDVEVVYEGQSRSRLFSGTIDKTYSLSEVLKVLELGKVNYRIELSLPGPSKHKRLVIIP
ncbi:FecR family protein [Mucilaginibacter sp. RCC_168]|uniref:FecR family protein n=1 Tax=Mucilaginibacter sp. RCC_168 TaxID=3239221 RepID=UPI003523D630